VILNQLFVLAALVVQKLTDRLLPPHLRNYVGGEESLFDTQIASSLSDVIYWLVLLMGLIASAGLCLEKRWGRTLFVLTFVTALVNALLVDFYVDTGWTVFVSYLVGVTDGMIIALVYFSPVKRMFEKSRQV
jgi:hypothetical protein